MFQIIILVASSLALAAAVQFTDCATDPSDTVATIHQLDFSPSTITFPGNLNVTLNITTNKQINQLFVDVELDKITLGLWTKVPCILNIGTCQNIEFCSMLDRILNGSSLVPKEFGHQVQAMLQSALGHKPHCPIQPENLFIDNYQLTLQAIPGLLSAITTGEFKIKISLKDNTTTTDNLGCIQFKEKIGVGVPMPEVG
ncbi:ganglioside GM2 activator-like [Mercenaria mercenaria]|uniref:ganglioside GM2 activator-like n=1 Tax=Mercenaria mercenaria TaxID=6596 RepID=UPI00234E5CF5|nr:ganglioside GM2 activator-like [Mercenaria mercenaria]